MLEREQLIQEIEQVPDIIVREVLNFLLFLKEKTQPHSSSSFTATLETKQNNDLSSTNKPHSLIDFIEQMDDELPPENMEALPRDFAANLDHYLYGSPKAE